MEKLAVSGPSYVTNEPTYAPQQLKRAKLPTLPTEWLLSGLLLMITTWVCKGGLGKQGGQGWVT